MPVRCPRRAPVRGSSAHQPHGHEVRQAGHEHEQCGDEQRSHGLLIHL
ncbi:hypothetical protein STXM2123_3475 [Streptomyces sp. F-3]|nr:hypothetical protein STXM2123_3475 [Streptomyces sp. F-3]